MADNPNPLYSAIAGLLVLFVAIGLCRFAYTPLIPNMINAAWVTKSGAGYLGTINFAGYLLGAFLGQRAGKYFHTSFIIKMSLIASVIGLALCAFNLGFIWLASWRFIVGVTGAILMVMTPSVILKTAPPHYRGKVAGLIFTGVGLGIIFSGFVVPQLASFNLAIAWLGISLFALIAVGIAWPAFAATPHSYISFGATHNTLHPQQAIILLGISYALYGIGFVPHTLFLVEYIHRELELSPVVSGLFWSLFGMGALIGPFSSGFIADKLGTDKTLIGAFILSCLSVAMVLYHHIIFFYVLSSFLMGILFLGIVTLTSSRIMELVGAEFHTEYWGKMTMYYALTQAAGAYFMSYLVGEGVPYVDSFAIAGFTLMIGLFAVALAR